MPNALSEPLPFLILIEADKMNFEVSIVSNRENSKTSFVKFYGMGLEDRLRDFRMKCKMHSMLFMQAACYDAIVKPVLLKEMYPTGCLKTWIYQQR